MFVPKKCIVKAVNECILWSLGFLKLCADCPPYNIFQNKCRIATLILKLSLIVTCRDSEDIFDAQQTVVLCDALAATH